MEAESPPGVASTRLVVAVVLLLMAFTLVLIVLSFGAGFYAIFSGALSTTYNAGSYLPTFIWVGPAYAILPFEVPLGVMFVLLSAIYAAMFVYMASTPSKALEGVRRSLSTGVQGLTSSPILVILLAIGFADFTDTWLTYLVQAAGAPIGNPLANIDPFLEFSILSFAPLNEEFGFRLILIGVVALVLSMGRPARQALGALWRPSVAYEGLAVGGITTAIIWAAVAFSSVTFGVCHAVCGGGGWDWGKVIPAAWGGLVFGYLYVKFGFPAAVLAHWGVDYFSSAFAFFGQAAFGINALSGPVEYAGQLLVEVDVVYLFGLASFLVVVYLAIRRLVEMRSRGNPLGPVDKGPPAGVGAEP